jgi:glycosyltransferase involved in cell wall biosynthesis
VKAINRNINYQFCHESLRRNFYNSNKWSLNNCRKHSIFLSQGGSPIKGLHQVIKAIGLLKKDYPDIILKVAGMDITRREGIYNKIKFTGYGKYIVSLIKREKLENSIRFLGPLAEDAMIKQYLEAHLFVCPSSIENSPNSLAEAQILGVPSIASFVGGIPDMVENHRTGLLYRFEAIEELAEYIRLLFEDSTLASNLSINEAEMAKKRHDKKAILENTLSIYNKIS